METEGARLGIAFALVVLAGLCAPLGASVVVFMKKSHTGLLAASIALAAGVMLFVSLTEVLSDSVEELSHGGWSKTVTLTYIYMAFFFGIALCKVLDWVADSLTAFINRMSERQRRRQKHSPSSNDISASGIDEVQLCSSMHEAIHLRHSKDGSPPLSPKAVHHRHSVLISGDVETASSQCDLMSTCSAAEGAAGRRSTDDEPALAIITNAQLAATDEHDRNIAEAVGHLGEADCGHLVRTSILVWLALSLHNLPEGLATIVGYMASPHLGVTVAVAIAIHNIPEGIALGVPVFFATGSKWKAIGWAALSGAAEPIGALIGLALQLTGRLNPVAMGIIMAVVAGIMTGICFQELIPRALSFDPGNKYTTVGVFVGMGIMAFSLLLLSLWDTSM